MNEANAQLLDSRDVAVDSIERKVVALDSQIKSFVWNSAAFWNR